MNSANKKTGVSIIHTEKAVFIHANQSTHVCTNFWLSMVFKLSLLLLHQIKTFFLSLPFSSLMVSVSVELVIFFWILAGSNGGLLLRSSWVEFTLLQFLVSNLAIAISSRSTSVWLLGLHSTPDEPSEGSLGLQALWYDWELWRRFNLEFWWLCLQHNSAAVSWQWRKTKKSTHK